MNKEENLYFIKCLIRVYKECGFMHMFKQDCPRGIESIFQRIQGSRCSLHDLCLNFLWCPLKTYTESYYKSRPSGLEITPERLSGIVASIGVIKLAGMMESCERMADASKIVKIKELEFIASCASNDFTLEKLFKENEKFWEFIKIRFNDENLQIVKDVMIYMNKYYLNKINYVSIL